MANKTSKKSGGTEKNQAGKSGSQYQSSQDKISGYLKEHEEAVKNSPSRQQMIAMEREAAEKEAAKKAQMAQIGQQMRTDMAIDSIESQAMEAIKAWLQQGKGAFEQTDREQGPFSGYEDPVQLALNVQGLKGIGPQKTWREDALKLGQKAVEQKRQEYAQMGTVDEYLEKLRTTNMVFRDDEEKQKYLDEYYSNIPYTSDYEQKQDNPYTRLTDEERVYEQLDGTYSQRDERMDAMTDEELKTMTYLRNTQGNGAAQRYYNQLEEELGRRVREGYTERLTQFGTERPVLGSALSTWMNMGNAIRGGAYVAGNALGKLTGQGTELDPYDRAFEMGAARDALRGGVSEDMPEWGKFLYQTGMSIGDSAIAGILGGPTGGALLMGSGAAVDTVRDVKERGGSDQQALTMGVIAGGAELLTEKIQFDRLGDLIGGNRDAVLRVIAENMISEGAEEGLTEIANILADTLVMGDKSEYNALVNQYMAQGMSADVAYKQAFVDMAAQAGLAALGGSISGGVMSGGAAAIGSVAKEVNRRQNITNALGYGARGDYADYDRVNQLAAQAYENQQAQEAPARAMEAPEAAAETNAEAAAQTPQQRAVNPAIEQMAQEYGEDAGLFTAHYEGGDETVYKTGFDAMFRAGQSGLPLNMLGGVSDQLTAGMSEATRQAIYTAGRNKAAQTITPGAKNLTSGKLTGEQRTFLRVWDAIGKEYGFEVDLVDDVTGANGAYRSGGRRIVVSAKAAENAYTQAAGHETVHYLKSVNPEGYNVLEDVVLKYLTDEDSYFDLETAIRERMKEYAGKSLTREEAIEEIVAEAVPTFFSDRAAATEFVNRNPTLAEKIRDFFYDFVKKIREIAERYMQSQNRDEIANLLGKTEALTEIAKTLDAALRKAQEKAGEAKGDGEIMTARRRSNDADDLSKWTPDARFMEEIMTTAERGIFRTIMNDRKNLPAKKMPNGEYVVEAGRALVYTDGKMTNPRIRQIVYFYTNDGTDLDGAMDLWRRGEREGIEYERTRTIIESILGEEGVVVYHNDDFREIQGKDNRRTGTNGRRFGEGNRGEVSADRGTKFSLKQESNQTDSEAFKKWFGDSKIVNADGTPKVMYHGTDAYKEFTIFKKGKRGWLGPGIYLSESPSVADSYAKKNGYDGRSYALYAKVEKPLIVTEGNPVPEILRAVSGSDRLYNSRSAKQTNDVHLITSADIKKLQAKGYDGIVWEFGKGPIEVSVFSPEQIKSATDNVGTFDPENPDIRYSLKRDQQKAVREAQAEDWKQISAGEIMVQDLKVDEETVRRQAAGALNKGLRDKLNQQISMAANRILRDTESKYGRNELKEQLSQIVKQYAANGNAALMAEELAGAIIEKSVRLTESEAAKQYADAREKLRNAKISLTETQKQEIVNEYGSVDAYRKAVFGTVNVRNEGTTLESLWAELSELYPEIFPPETNEAQMPGVIAQFDRMMKPRYENIYGMDTEAAVTDLALRIQGDVLGMVGAKQAAHDLYGTADKFRRQIRKEYDAEIRAQQKARVDEFQKIAGKLKAAKDKGDSVEQKKIMAEYRRALNKVDTRTAISEVRAAEKVRYEQRTENREAAQLRDKITKRANELMDMLAGRKKGKRVPTKLQGLVIDVLGALDINGERAAEAFTESKRAAQFREKLTGIKNFYAQVMESQSKGESPEGLDGLMMTISERNMAAMTEALEVLGNGEVFELRNMTSEQLRSLNSLLKEVTHTVNSIGKLWKMKRYESIIELGDESIAEMDSRGKQKINEATAAGKTRDFFALDMMEPVSYGERLGEAGQAVIQGLMDGEKEKFSKIREASEATEQMLKDVGVKGYDVGRWKKHVREVDLGGKKVKMTDAMLMSLYLTAKRPQGRQHLLANGMRLPTTKETGAQVFTVQLSEKDLAHAASLLSDKQRALCDRMGNYLSTTVAKWGNDVTQRMYLYDAFTEKNYWPITSDPNVLKTQEPEGERAFNAIINAGFTKPVNQKATNAVIVQDAFDVFGGHIGEMASYAGYAEVMTDTLAWLNYKKRDSETKLIEGSVKESMEKLLGKGGEQYLKKLLQDINGARRGGDNVQLGKLLGNYKKAAVMGKIRVAIQQPTSIVRAAAEINPGYLLTGLHAPRGTIAEMQKWSPLAWWKANGNYDIGVGKGMDEILWGKTAFKDTVMDKVATQGGLIDPGRMDDWAWARMWTAVKREVARTRKDLAPGSDEYFRAVAERFEYIMDRTQVVDTVMHRSDIMRSKDGLNKQITSFMGEPIKGYNMLMRAVMDVGRDPKNTKAQTKLVRATAAYVASAAATAAATALVDAFRYRDDEEETLDYLINGEFARDWGEQWLKGFMGNVNPVESVPLVSSIVSALGGEEITLMAFDTFTDIKDAWDKLYNYFAGNNTKKLTIYGAVSPAAKALSELTGTPFNGIIANAEIIGRIFDPKWAQTKSSMATQEKAFAELYKAMASGDSKKALEIRTQMAKGMYGNEPKSPKQIDTGIYKELARQDERVMQAYEMKLAGNKAKELVALRKEIMADGFTEAQVNGAINYYETLLKGEEQTEKNMDEQLTANLYESKDLFSAIRGGDTEDVAAVADYLEGISTAQDPAKTIRSNVASEFKKEYLDYVENGQAGKAKALAEKLAVVGIEQEDLDGWVKDDYKADMKQYVSDGNVQKALEVIDELKGYGMDVSGIVSSLNSEFKERYVELVNGGRRTEADRLGRTLQGLGLYWKDGKTNYYRDEKLEEWLEED